jgi:alkylated DNA nucleotide flippase Atl1
MARKATAREKLAKAKGGELVDTPKGRMYIPRPLEVDALMRQVPSGKLATTDRIRERLAREHGADYACPLVTGIFVRLAAEAAVETIQAGERPVTPFWRTIRGDGSLNEKYPGGTAEQARLLGREGHAVVPGKGKKPPKVADFEQHLVRF